MREHDLQPFTELLDAVCLLLSRGAYAPDARNTALWFKALSVYDLASVRYGFDAHVRDPQRGKFVPVPADILFQIDAARLQDGRPESDEAWAIATKARDEAVTVVWTEEVAEAWAIALPVMEAGDEVGARMAFKAAYNRLLGEARATRQPTRWSASLGHNEALRHDALTKAVEAGRLPDAYLPAQRGPIAGLIELSQVRGMPADLKAKLLDIKRQFTEGEDGPSADVVAKTETAQRKREIREQVRRYQEGRDETV